MLWLIWLMSMNSFAAGKTCTCTCIVKDGDSYTTRTGKGSDREAAGEALKKILGKKKCEISPECKGSGCKLD